MRGLCVAVLSAVASMAATAGSGPVTAGRAVADVLREAQSTGIRVIFTDQSVPPGLRVAAEPRSGERVARLREILSPHALQLEQVTPEVYVVVRAQKTAPPSVPPEQPDVPLREIQVTTSRYTLDSLSQGSFELSGVEMQRQPALFNDATRSIRRFPGTAGQDLSSRTFVRGGTPDDNLILLDGVPLYDPFHLAGLPLNFSVIDPTLVDGLDFYSGVLPVEHGGRMGGLLNMRLLDPPERAGGRISLGALDASALASGPLPASRGDWLLFGRRGLLGRTVKLTASDQDIGRPDLFDGLGRVRYELNDDATLAVGALTARDNAQILSSHTQIDDSASRLYGWAIYERQGAGVRSRTALSYTSLDTFRLGYLDDVFESLGRLTDRRSFSSARIEQSWTLPVERGAMRWGGVLRHDRARFDYHRSLQFQEDVAAFFQRPTTAFTTTSAEPSARVTELFWGWNRELIERLTLDAGVSWQRTAYSIDQTASSLDPRMGLRFDLTDRTRLRFSHGRMTQHWSAAELPVEQDRLQFDEPSTSTMSVLALEQDFGSWLSVRVEGFHKHIENPRPRLENVFFPGAFLPELRADQLVLRPDSSDMSGIDLYATARFSDRLSGWLSYSRSRALDSIDGSEIARAWDQPHSGGIGIAMTGSAWLLSAEVIAHSSWPLTPLRTTLTTEAPNDIIRHVGERSSEREGVYLSLNLKAARSFQFSSGSLRVALEVANATDRTNLCCNELVFYRTSFDNNVDAFANAKRFLPVVPYATVAWEFGGIAAH